MTGFAGRYTQVRVVLGNPDPLGPLGGSMAAASAGEEGVTAGFK